MSETRNKYDWCSCKPQGQASTSIVKYVVLRTIPVLYSKKLECGPRRWCLVFVYSHGRRTNNTMEPSNQLDSEMLTILALDSQIFVLSLTAKVAIVLARAPLPHPFRHMSRINRTSRLTSCSVLFENPIWDSCSNRPHEPKKCLLMQKPEPTNAPKHTHISYDPESKHPTFK